MLTQYFHTDSCASCKNFEGLFGGVKLWRIHWNLLNSSTFPPPKYCAIRYYESSYTMNMFYSNCNGEHWWAKLISGYYITMHVLCITKASS